MSELRSTVKEAMGQRINYAQCWEDTQILLEALDIGPEDDVLSIASAGDNSFAIAMAGAKSVTAIDLALPQLAVTDLKLAASGLPYDDFVTLLGLRTGNRRALYQRVRDDLGEDYRQWWDGHLDVIDAGVCGAGRFEKYLGSFRTRLLPFIHSRGTVETLADMDDLDQQRTFYDTRWNNWRWRALFKIFFSQTIMQRSGRSPEQFAHVKGPVGAEFLRRAKHGLTEIPVRTNPYIQWILRGRYPDLELSHPYLTKQGHARLAEVRGNIRLVHDTLEKHLQQAGAGAYSAFNYSDLFEYVSAEQHEAMLELSIRSSRPGTRIVYWNLLVPRSRPESMATVLTRREEAAAEWLRRDRFFVYGGYNVEVVAS